MTSTTDDAQGLDLDLGQALGTVLRSYTTAARDVAEDVPGGPRGYQVLTVASSASCRNQAGIAQVLGIDRTVMTALVDKLETSGLVERRPDPADRRARQVVLTAAGEQVRTRVAERIADVERALLAPLGPSEAADLRRLLGAVAATAGAPGLNLGVCHEGAGSDADCSGPL